jgi:hypothetical protein
VRWSAGGLDLDDMCFVGSYDTTFVVSILLHSHERVQCISEFVDESKVSWVTKQLRS